MRRALRCGFEHEHPPDAVAWTHPGAGGREPVVCIGYAQRLPEVREVARARLHWDKGQLETLCNGQPGELLLALIEVLEISARHLEMWLMKNPPAGAG